MKSKKILLISIFCALLLIGFLFLIDNEYVIEEKSKSLGVCYGPVPDGYNESNYHLNCEMVKDNG